MESRGFSLSFSSFFGFILFYFLNRSPVRVQVQFSFFRGFSFSQRALIFAFLFLFLLDLDLNPNLVRRWPLEIRRRPHPYFERKLISGWFLCHYIGYKMAKVVPIFSLKGRSYSFLCVCARHMTAFLLIALSLPLYSFLHLPHILKPQSPTSSTQISSSTRLKMRHFNSIISELTASYVSTPSAAHGLEEPVWSLRESWMRRGILLRRIVGVIWNWMSSSWGWRIR